MDRKQKLVMIEEMLELDRGSLNEGMTIEEIESWDSIAVISLIALVDEHFGKTLSTSEIKQFRTLKDVLDYLEKK
jgi:acyl carrier protein